MFRHCVPALMAAGLVPASASRAELAEFLVDYAPFLQLTSTADGRLAPDEYGLGNSQYLAGYGLTRGLGGALADPGSRLYFAQGPAGLHLAFSPGAQLRGTVVVFLDTAPGGRSAGSGPGVTPLNDTATPARRAMSSLRGRYPSDPRLDYTFTADTAVTFGAAGARAWQVPDADGAIFTPLGAARAATGAPETPFFETLIPGAGLGAGAKLFAAYVSGDGLLSDETLPSQPFAALGNPGDQLATATPVDFPEFAMISTFIPAPATLLPLILGAGLLPRRRRAGITR